MHVGVLAPYQAGVMASPDFVARFAELVEDNGFESIWTVEHMVVPASYDTPYPYGGGRPMPLNNLDIPDPLALLSFIAGVTRRVNLGTSVVLLPQRNPVATAKEVATVDALSGGRMLLGVGVGWMPEEAKAVGTAWEDRGARMDEYIGAIRALWRDREASYAGRYVQFERVRSLPHPVRPGGVPIIVGGHSRAALRRAGRLGDGYISVGIGADELPANLEVVRSAAVEAGREPMSIEITTRGETDPGVISRLRDLGVSRMRFHCDAGDIEAAGRWLGELSERVIGRAS